MVEMYEIRIRRVNELSPEAQIEVSQKVRELPDDFNFRGFAKVTYGETSPLTILSVDPIEGTVIDFFKSVTSFIDKK